MISKQGECDSSSIYLSILYINVFTFSDLNNWDQNLGMFDRSVAYREYPIPWNNITWAAHPFNFQGHQEW